MVTMVFTRHNSVFAAALYLLLLTTPAVAQAESSFAPVMPLASRSLLLDIAAAGDVVNTRAFGTLDEQRLAADTIEGPDG